MTRSDFLEALIQFLAIVGEKHNFSAGPLTAQTRTRLAAFKNTAKEKGMRGVEKYLAKALDTHNATAQEILLFKGITKDSGLDAEPIKSLQDVVYDAYTSDGGDVESVKASVLDMLNTEEEDADKDLDLDDSLSAAMDAGGLDDEPVEEPADETLPDDADGSGQDLEDLGLSLGDEEPAGDSKDSEEEINPDDLAGDSQETEPEVTDGEVEPNKDGDRVAKEGDDESPIEYRQEKAALNDWKIFEWLQLK